MSSRSAWKVRVHRLEWRGGLFWRFLATNAEREIDVTAHTGWSGEVLDLQTSDGYIGGTGDTRLDGLIGEEIAGILAWHRASRALGEIERQERVSLGRWAR